MGRRTKQHTKVQEFYDKGFSVDEVAEILELDEQTVLEEL